jgi:glycosyltransferase involved in cell wall biosynthesis
MNPTTSPLFRPVVLAPTFNNAATLGDVLKRARRVGLPILAVDDGSTDGTAAILERWRAEGESRLLVTHPRNRGKATALRSGFTAAVEAGFTHAITIDTDGQLDPAQIPLLAAAAERAPAALVLGCRDDRAPDYPGRSRLGRRVSNLLVRWESGARVEDSQCGFRVYPLALVGAIGARANRYGFETEVISRAAWARIPIEQVPVTCKYDVEPRRVSHFRPWRDSLAAVGMHVRLLLRSALPWPVRRLGECRETGKLWARLIRWISPARAWRGVRHDPAERPRFAAAFALGVFIANLPLYGFQTLLSFYAARRVRLNPLAIVAGSHLSTPPVGPMLIAAAITVGHWMLHGTPPALRDYAPSAGGYIAMLRSLALEWVVGSVICGAVLAGAAFVITNWLLGRLPTTTTTTADTATGSAAHPGGPAPGRDRASATPAV